MAEFRYPSWYDYLGFAGENRDHIMKIIKGPVPEEIAQKLGIEPKE